MSQNGNFPPPNLSEYEGFYRDFSWEQISRQLSYLPEGKGLNIAYEAIDRHADGHLGDTAALRWVRKDGAEVDYTYAQMKDLTNRFANVLEHLEIGTGETVFSLAGRIPELYITVLGALKRTAVFCPLFSVFGPEPVFQRLSRGKAALLVTTTTLYEKKVLPLLDQLPALRYVLLTDAEDHLSEKVLSFHKMMGSVSATYQIPDTDPETPALLHFTSGTTGMPKGALHVHQAVFTHFATGKYILDFKEGDIFWCTADPGWVTGTSYGIIAPLVNGVTNIIDEEEFEAMRWYGLLEKQKVNIWYTAPTAIRRLMRLQLKPMEQFDLSRLRLILSVGEPLHAEEVLWGQETFGMPILDNWWQTETGGIMIANYRSMQVKPGSMGKPLPGIIASIAEFDEQGNLVEVERPEEGGQLVLKRGWPSMFRTYIHEEERYNKCFHGDWYISGDLAKRDADGYFWFIGRADDIIKTSGHMVGPAEVESVLIEHPAVVEAAVIGKPEPSIGELVKAFVVLKEGEVADKKQQLSIIGFARQRMGPAVAPKEIEFVEALPKTKSGKILRRLLKARELGLPEGDLSTLEK
jgi:acetyl-CoA synthetase